MPDRRAVMSRIVSLIVAATMMCSMAVTSLAVPSVHAEPVAAGDLTSRLHEVFTSLSLEEEDFERKLVEDIAKYDEEPEVREAAKAALASSDPQAIRKFLDHGLDEAKRRAEERKAAELKKNKALLEEWAKSGTPTVRKRAAEILARGDAKEIAQFVATGKDIAEAIDKQIEEEKKKVEARIRANVEKMVETGGPRVRAEGRIALDSQDPAVIKKFHDEAFPVLSKQDRDTEAAIQKALDDRIKLVSTLADLAERTTKASKARTQILRAGVQASHALAEAMQEMRIANNAAKRADVIFEQDKASRPQGVKGRDAELARLFAEASEAANRAAPKYQDADRAYAQAVDGAKKLAETQLTEGMDWAKVAQSVAKATQAAVFASHTAKSAAEATLAASRALDANDNAQGHADNAKRYRESAEAHAKEARELELAAQWEAEQARLAAGRAKDARVKAQAAEKRAWTHAANAKKARNTAEHQAQIAADAMAKALAHQATASAGARSAIHHQNMATEAGRRVAEANAASRQKMNDFNFATAKARGAAMRFQLAGERLDAKEAYWAKKNAEAEAAKGTEHYDSLKNLADQARAARDTARTHRDGAKTASAQATGAAQAAGREAARAREAAHQAALAARTATKEANAAHAAAGAARAEAVKSADEAAAANRHATDAIDLATEAMSEATQAVADAEATKAEAEAAIQQSAMSAVQANISARAAVAAQRSASATAAPAGEAINGGTPYVDVNVEAAMAVNIGAEALLISIDQAKLAERKALEAAKAAEAAKDAAARAVGEVKPAYEAAQAAADSANAASRYAREAVDWAITAEKEAAAARTAAHRAAQADRQAQIDAAAARAAAGRAHHCAAVAGQAYAAARQDAEVAAKARDNVIGLVKVLDDMVSEMDTNISLITPIVEAMPKMLQEMAEALPKIEDAADDARLKHEFVKALVGVGLQDLFFKNDPLTGLVYEFKSGMAEQIVNMAIGVWTVGKCFAGNGTVCQELWAGIKAVIQNPSLLLPVEEFKVNPVKALGMLSVDVGMMFLGGAGVVTKPGQLIGLVTTKGVGQVAVNLAKMISELGVINTGKILARAGVLEFTKFALEFEAKNVSKLIDDINAAGAGGKAATALGKFLGDAGSLDALKFATALGPDFAKALAKIDGGDLAKVVAGAGADKAAHIVKAVGAEHLAKLFAEIKAGEFTKLLITESAENVAKLIADLGAGDLGKLLSATSPDLLRGAIAGMGYDKLIKFSKEIGASPLGRFLKDLGVEKTAKAVDELGGANLNKLVNEAGVTKVAQAITDIGPGPLRKAVDEVGASEFGKLLTETDAAKALKAVNEVGGKNLAVLTNRLGAGKALRLIDEVGGKDVVELLNSLGADKLGLAVEHLGASRISRLVKGLGSTRLSRLLEAVSVDRIASLCDNISGQDLGRFLDNYGEQESYRLIGELYGDYLGRMIAKFGPVDVANGFKSFSAAEMEAIKLVSDFEKVSQKLVTPENGAYFWSGKIGGPGGEGVIDKAVEIATSRGGTTLEMLMKKQGIAEVRWNKENGFVQEFWSIISTGYANGTSGTVYAVLGDSLRPDAVWTTRELPALKANPRVNRIVEIDAATGVQKTIWERP